MVYPSKADVEAVKCESGCEGAVPEAAASSSVETVVQCVFAMPTPYADATLGVLACKRRHRRGLFRA